jgi:hypothetical protein
VLRLTAKRISVFFKGMIVTKSINSFGAVLSALGAVAKLLKETVSFVTSICPSVHQHGTTGLPLEES